ncbi:MAG: CHAT domain-containing protein, partial [Candidatus Bipolaricaulota bacterium]|nr:CHAT domain-containing protein [Candidatus Bipolaricaulota bacterium]
SYPAQRWVIHNNRGVAYERLKRFEEAVAAYREALAVIESIRGFLRTEKLKLAWGERTRRVYERLIDLLYRMGRGSEAFPYSERCRARTFLDLLAQGPVGTLENVADEGIRSGVVEPSVIEADLREVVQGLPDDTAVLEYFTTEKALYLWLITRGKVADPIRIAVERETLLAQVLAFRQAIETPPQRGKEVDALLDLLRQARDLYDLLLAPVARDIAGYAHLVVVPSGPLYYLPFAALYDCPGCRERALQGGTYQIERTTVTYLPSLTTLKYAQEKRLSATAQPMLFALGDPDSGNPSYRRLPGAQEEVRAIARLFTPPPQPTVVLGGDATQTALRLEGTGARHVVLSTHGIFNPLNPMYSYLLVAPSAQDDEKLHTHEVFGLGLRADLVTLSACETLLPSLRAAERQVRAVRGGGEDEPVVIPPELLERITSGDELVGLTRAFIYAGTPTVVSTLWSVYDESTRHLMVAFYRRLLAAQTDKAQALRQAQLLLLRDPLYRHPVHWAPFVLYGDWR